MAVQLVTLGPFPLQSEGLYDDRFYSVPRGGVFMMTGLFSPRGGGGVYMMTGFTQSRGRGLYDDRFYSVPGKGSL